MFFKSEKYVKYVSSNIAYNLVYRLLIAFSARCLGLKCCELRL